MCSWFHLWGFDSSVPTCIYIYIFIVCHPLIQRTPVFSSRYCTVSKRNEYAYGYQREDQQKQQRQVKADPVTVGGVCSRLRLPSRLRCQLLHVHP